MLVEAGVIALGVLGANKIYQNHQKAKAAAAALLNAPASGNANTIANAAPVTGSTASSVTPSSPNLTGSATYETMPDSPAAPQGVVNTITLDPNNPQSVTIEGNGQSQLSVVAPSGLQIGDLDTDTASAFGVLNRQILPNGSVTLVPMMGGGTVVNFTVTLSDGSTALATVSLS